MDLNTSLLKTMSQPLINVVLEILTKLLPYPSATSGIPQHLYFLQGLLIDNPENQQWFVDVGGVCLLQQYLKKFSEDVKKNKRLLRPLIAVVCCFPEALESRIDLLHSLDENKYSNKEQQKSNTNTIKYQYLQSCIGLPTASDKLQLMEANRAIVKKGDYTGEGNTKFQKCNDQITRKSVNKSFEPSGNPMQCSKMDGRSRNAYLSEQLKRKQDNSLYFDESIPEGLHGKKRRRQQSDDGVLENSQDKESVSHTNEIECNEEVDFIFDTPLQQIDDNLVGEYLEKPMQGESLNGQLEKEIPGKGEESFNDKASLIITIDEMERQGSKLKRNDQIGQNKYLGGLEVSSNKSLTEKSCIADNLFAEYSFFTEDNCAETQGNFLSIGLDANTDKKEADEKNNKERSEKQRKEWRNLSGTRACQNNSGINVNQGAGASEVGSEKGGRFKASSKFDEGEIQLVREAEKELQEEIKQCIVKELAEETDRAETILKGTKAGAGLAFPLQRCWNFFFSKEN